jgi:hypothetical protein|tara:strand:- start:6334 stop:6474 length:141 start_codon:yes stop_codon:yes gene_type:complete
MLLKKNRALPGKGGTISAKEMKMFKSLFPKRLKPKKSQKAKKPKGK